MRVTPPHHGRPPLGERARSCRRTCLSAAHGRGAQQRPGSASRSSAGVVVVLVRLLFDELNEVAACVVKDGHDSGADVGRRLRDYDAVATAVPRFNSDEAFRTGSVLRNPTEGRASYDRRKSEGKTSMEALRA